MAAGVVGTAGAVCTAGTAGTAMAGSPSVVAALLTQRRHIYSLHFAVHRASSYK